MEGTLVLLFIFGIFGAFVLYSYFTSGNDNHKKKKRQIYSSNLTTITVTEGSWSYDDQRKEEQEIKNEIRQSIEKHKQAINILQALARVDGSTTIEEKNHIFLFLLRQGQDLSYSRHRPFFHGYYSGEWGRAIEIIEFEDCLTDIDKYPYEYKLDIYNTAVAIVGSGAKPKKRESECLKILGNYISKQQPGIQ